MGITQDSFEKMFRSIILGVYSFNFITKNTAIFILLKKHIKAVGITLTLVLVLSDNRLYTFFLLIIVSEPYSLPPKTIA